MRSLTSGIAGQLAAAGVTVSGYLGWLVELTPINGGVFRFTSLDANFSFGGFTWLTYDIGSPTLIWDGTVLRPARITFGDTDGVLWMMAKAVWLTDATVRIYQVYAAVSTEAEAVWSGKVGTITRNPSDGAVTLTLTDGNETMSSPRTRIQELVAEQYFMPSGTILNIGGQQTILNRPDTAAG